MIKGYISQADQMVEVTIAGDGLKFMDITNDDLIMPNFVYLKVIQEFPDLKDDKDWAAKAFERFKQHFLKIEGEMNRLKYIVAEMIKQGYKPEYYEENGFRRRRFE
ncbi:MAG: hypothetical protein ABSG05_03455 [Candidatus Pacearchaeota archaeon]|jgi:hypothetical protein